jgi:Uma2 family endonuclease
MKVLKKALLKPDEKYSYTDYLSWPEEERWEIIDGVPYMQATPTRIHQEISGNIFVQIHTYLSGKSCKVYHAPFCVRLDTDKNNNKIENVAEPDITVVCDQSKLDKVGCKGAPDLIVEILSPSTGRKDKLLKFDKYEKAGAKEYCLVEPEEKYLAETNWRSYERIQH